MSKRPLGDEEIKSVQKMLESIEAYAVIYYDDIRHLEGKLLTLIDASIQDLQQRKALKDIFRQILWWHWVPTLERQQPDLPVGMPDVGVEN